MEKNGTKSSVLTRRKDHDESALSTTGKQQWNTQKITKVVLDRHRKY